MTEKLINGGKKFREDMKLATERMNSTSPPFFKRLRKYAFIGTVVLTGAIAGVSVVGLPVWIIASLTTLNVMCGTFLGSTYLPTTDRQLSAK